MAPSASSSVRNFLLQQEFPENALQKAQNSLKTSEQHCLDGGVGRTSDGCCQCPHWRKYLPHRLDFSFCEVIKTKSEKEEEKGSREKGAPRTAWVPQHPVHALHFQSLLDDPLDSFYGDEAPVLFGDEQERLIAVKTEGIVESWHPWIEPSDPSPVAFVDNSPPLGASCDADLAAKGPSATTITKTATDFKKDTSNIVKAPSDSVAGAISSQNSSSASVAAAPPEPESNSNNPSSQSDAAKVTSPTDENIPKATSDSSLPSSESPMVASDPATSLAPPPALPAGSSNNNSVDAVNSTLPSLSMVEATIAAPETVSSAATTPTPNESAPSGSKHEQQQSNSMYLLPEATFSSWHTAEEQIRLIRHAFLSKRKIMLPVKRKAKSGLKASETTTSTSKVDKKRKSDISHSGADGSSLQTMLSDWKLPQHQPLQSIDSITDESRNISGPEILKPTLKTGITLDSYEAQQQLAARTVEMWMEYFRSNRKTYWREQKQQYQQPSRKTGQSSSMAQPQWSTPLFRSELTSRSVFGSIARKSTNSTSVVNRPAVAPGRCCQECCQLRSGVPQGHRGGNEWLIGASTIDEEDEDDHPYGKDADMLFQCLECSFIGCAPASVCSGRESRQHMTLHFLQSNHNFAVSCGRRAQIYCFQCSDFVYHPIFDQEKERIDLTECLPWQAWKEHAVQRSFDAIQFFHLQDQGIFWRGVLATYPPLVPVEHVQAARACLNRQRLFMGQVIDLPFLRANQRPDGMRFATRQQTIASKNRWKIPAPVGMYNLGNTCFMSSILQCLVNCVPLQRYFLKDLGHNHEACLIYRKMTGGRPGILQSDSSKWKKSPSETICLACEMDKLCLCYMGSAIGVDVLSAVSDSEGSRSGNSIRSNGTSGSKVDRLENTVVQGDPLVISTMLSSAWKCVAMKHLAGYGQRDAHEFLHGFLEIMGRHMQLYRTTMFKVVNMARPLNSFVHFDGERSSQYDEVKSIFEGTLRSILVCRECGAKRTQTEPFLSISLPLSKEVQMAASSPTKVNEKLSVELCLRHFTMPELLADPVDCPSCGKKTQTKKQHVVSKLPKILCLHLKRFDAAQNKKIEDFVAFPSQGLNMGQYLPHWCEVSRVPTEVDFVNTDDATVPQIAYDLFGTVNHYGSLQSGHYVANLKVNEQWYHCNDAHVYYAGVEDGEAEVLKSDGAYLLFYERR